VQILAWMAAVGGLALAGSARPNAQPAELVEIRVGAHPGYTRVVFELDAESGYGLRPREGKHELVVELEAHSSRRVMTSRSDVVESVRVEPTPQGSVARIQLRRPAEVSQLVLADPPRIVLDLRPAEPEPAQVAATSPPAGAPAGESPAAAPPAPEVSPAPEPTAARPPEAEPAPAEVAALPTPPEAARPGEPDLDRPGEPPQAEPPPAPAETAPTAEPGEPAAAEPIPPTPSVAERPPDAEGVAPSRGPGPAGPLERREHPVPAPSAEERAGPSLVAQLTALLSRLPEPLQDARLLAGVAGALAVVLLLASWSRARRRDRRRRSLFADLPGAGEPEPEVEARPEIPFELALPRAEEAELPRASSLFDTAAGMEAPEDEEKPPPAAAAFRPAPDRAAPTPSGVVGATPERRVEDLERRLGDLERRLEEVLDAKDRLERHVAAQTEELRVQRAAIARTQRVLRNLARPDEGATEPAPKE
jgi:hypothetical protein